jgi:hypothetical protein
MKTWTATVRATYASLEDLEHYDHIFGTVARCGFATAKELWEANPVIGGSVYPKDFGVATEEEVAILESRNRHGQPKQPETEEDYDD